MHFAMAFLRSFVAVALDAAPWLLLGLVFSGLVKAWVPMTALQRWLGGTGLWPIVKAAFIGTPLPLCSCSVMPVALSLRRSGASKGATISFLIATPENGADSVTISYALLGPVMTIARVVSALVSAIAAGALTDVAEVHPTNRPMALEPARLSNAADMKDECCTAAAPGPRLGPLHRLRLGLIYGVTDLLDDIAPWILLGIGLAALVNVAVPHQLLAEWGKGPWAMILMVLIGVPMYVCASASTPLAASLLAAGVSPGTVLVFLLAGPATNVGTVAIVRRELGIRALLTYLLGVSAAPIAMGLLLDQFVGPLIPRTTTQSCQVACISTWIGVAATLVLTTLAIRPIRRRLIWRQAQPR